MPRRIALACGLLLAAIGCGKSGSPETAEIPPQTANSQQTPETTAPPAEIRPETAAPAGASARPLQIPAANAQPQEVVRVFLEATRQGDDQIAAAMLTRKAIEETSKRNLSVQPPGSPTMTYEIDRAEKAPNGGAYVKSLWTEAVGDIQEQYEVVWILRPEAEGWRISGMAAQFSEDSDPVLIDFEHPTDLAERVGGPATEENLVGSGDEGPAASTARRPPANGGFNR